MRVIPARGAVFSRSEWQRRGESCPCVDGKRGGRHSVLTNIERGAELPELLDRSHLPKLRSAKFFEPALLYIRSDGEADEYGFAACLLHCSSRYIGKSICDGRHWREGENDGAALACGFAHQGKPERLRNSMNAGVPKGNTAEPASTTR